MEDEQRATEEVKQLHRDLLHAHVALEAGYLDLQAQSKAQQRQQVFTDGNASRTGPQSQAQGRAGSARGRSGLAQGRAPRPERALPANGRAGRCAIPRGRASLKLAGRTGAPRPAHFQQTVEQVAAQSREAEHQAQKLAGREQALHAAEAQIEGLRADLAESQRQEQARTQQLQWVYESRSWQITAPLRFVSRAVGARCSCWQGASSRC